MNIPSLIRKLSGLYKLATGQAGTAEGDNARRQMNRMLEKAKVEIPDDQLEWLEIEVDTLNELDGDLASMIAGMTNTDAYKLKTDGDIIRFRGVRVCVEEAERIFIQTSQGMNRMAAFMSLGYIAGSLGPDVFLDYIEQAQKTGGASSTLEKGLEDAEEQAKKFNALDQDPTEQEGKVVQAATAAADTVTLWEKLER